MTVVPRWLHIWRHRPPPRPRRSRLLDAPVSMKSPIQGPARQASSSCGRAHPVTDVPQVIVELVLQDDGSEHLPVLDDPPWRRVRLRWAAGPGSVGQSDAFMHPGGEPRIHRR